MQHRSKPGPAPLTMKDAILAFAELKDSARGYAENGTRAPRQWDGSLHDAAMNYARVVQKITRRNRS